MELLPLGSAVSVSATRGTLHAACKAPLGRWALPLPFTQGWPSPLGRRGLWRLLTGADGQGQGLSLGGSRRRVLGLARGKASQS